MHRDPLPALLRRVGRYTGHGINHEDQPFHGELELYDLLDQHAVGVRFRATGIDGTVYHDERTWIGLAPEGALALWTIHTNAGTVLRHDLAPSPESPDSEHVLVFRLGDPENRSLYRTQVTLDLMRDGRIGYRFAWGLPGEPFLDRSKVSMTRLPSSP